MIVVSDVDKTLVDPGGVESEGCRVLFSTLAARGVRYGFATSRGYRSLAEILPDSLQNANFSICSDGAVVLAANVDAEGDLTVIARYLVPAPDQTLTELDNVRSDGSSLFVFFDDETAYSVAASVSARHDTAMSRILQGRPYFEGARSSVGTARGILSVGVLDNKDQCDRLARHLRSSYIDASMRVRTYAEVRVREVDQWWCEVSSMAADKAVALSALSRDHIGPRSGPLVVLGDGDNDVDLAAMADYAYCPPWADIGMLRTATILEGVKGCEDFTVQVLQRIIALTG